MRRVSKKRYPHAVVATTVSTMLSLKDSGRRACHVSMVDRTERPPLSIPSRLRRNSPIRNWGWYLLAPRPGMIESLGIVVHSPTVAETTCVRKCRYGCHSVSFYGADSLRKDRPNVGRFIFSPFVTSLPLLEPRCAGSPARWVVALKHRRAGWLKVQLFASYAGTPNNVVVWRVPSSSLVNKVAIAVTGSDAGGGRWCCCTDG